MRYLKEFFDTALPEELFVDAPVLKDITDIFIEYIEENVAPLYNLDYIYSMENPKINEELFKTYLYDLFTIFNEATQNKIILKELQLVMDNINSGYNAYNNNSILSVLNIQHINSAKSYKHKKGTKAAIEYVYNLVKASGFQPFSVVKNKNDLVFELDGQEYHFNKIEGSLIDKIYHNVVAYATHPVGFTYNYEMKTIIELLDYFGYNLLYNFTSLHVNYINGTVYDFMDKTVVEIYVENDDYIKFVFSTGEYLINNIGDIKYYNDNDTVHTDFAGCTLVYNYTTTLEKTIIDEFDTTMDAYDCDWFDVNTTEGISVIGQSYPYNIGNLYIDGVLGLSPFVKCDVTSTRQHLSDAPSLYASSDELIDNYCNIPFEIHIAAKADDNIECGGYGIICGNVSGYSELCTEEMAFSRGNRVDGIKHHIAVDVIDIQLIQE